MWACQRHLRPPAWCPHPLPSLHALQRGQPAQLASAGRRLMPLAPVSGWITASSAARFAASAMDLCFRAGSQMLRPAPRGCRSAHPVLNSLIPSSHNMMACLPRPWSEPLPALHPHPFLSLHALQPRQPARLASTGQRHVQPAPVSGCITAGSPPDAHRMRLIETGRMTLCFSRQPEVGLSAPPAPTCLGSTPTPLAPRLQSYQPAQLASAGRRLMPLAPVSGWIVCIVCSPVCFLGDGPVLSSWQQDAGARTHEPPQRSPTL
jgi:hypothetical protein